MGSADWLRMYAQRMEDEHAPHNLSIGMREVADQMDQQRETVLQLLGQVWQLSDEIERLRAALREAYEVYAGSDGFIPETASEGYQQQVIKQMVDCISAALEGK